jgi:hypothetical protein
MRMYMEFESNRNSDIDCDSTDNNERLFNIVANRQFTQHHITITIRISIVNFDVGLCVNDVWDTVDHSAN